MYHRKWRSEISRSYGYWRVRGVEIKLTTWVIVRLAVTTLLPKMVPTLLTYTTPIANACYIKRLHIICAEKSGDKETTAIRVGSPSRASAS